MKAWHSRNAKERVAAGDGGEVYQSRNLSKYHSESAPASLDIHRRPQLRLIALTPVFPLYGGFLCKFARAPKYPSG